MVVRRAALASPKSSIVNNKTMVRSSRSGGAPYNFNRSLLAAGLVGLGFLSLLAGSRKLHEAVLLEGDLKEKQRELKARNAARAARNAVLVKQFLEFSQEEQQLPNKKDLLEQQKAAIAQKEALQQKTPTDTLRKELETTEQKLNYISRKLYRHELIESQLKAQARKNFLEQALQKNPTDARTEAELRALEQVIQGNAQKLTKRNEQEQQQFRSQMLGLKLAAENQAAYLVSELKKPQSDEELKILKKGLKDTQQDIQEKTEFLTAIDEYIAENKTPVRQTPAATAQKEASFKRKRLEKQQKLQQQTMQEQKRAERGILAPVPVATQPTPPKLLLETETIRKAREQQKLRQQEAAAAAAKKMAPAAGGFLQFVAPQSSSPPRPRPSGRNSPVLPF